MAIYIILLPFLVTQVTVTMQQHSEYRHLNSVMPAATCHASAVGTTEMETTVPDSNAEWTC